MRIAIVGTGLTGLYSLKHLIEGDSVERLPSTHESAVMLWLTVAPPR